LGGSKEIWEKILRPSNGEKKWGIRKENWPFLKKERNFGGGKFKPALKRKFVLGVPKSQINWVF